MENFNTAGDFYFGNIMMKDTTMIEHAPSPYFIKFHGNSITFS
jgi:hypothetical protein